MTPCEIFGLGVRCLVLVYDNDGRKNGNGDGTAGAHRLHRLTQITTKDEE